MANKKKLKKIPRYLNEDEINALFGVCDNPRDSIILKMLYYFALRINELRHLKIEDIDFLKKEIVVVGKGSKVGKIPVLIDALPFFEKELKAWVKGKDPKEFVIPGNDKNGMISKRHLNRIVKKYARLAGIRKYWEIHPHTLRHSRATNLYNRGGNIELIKDFLRHARLTTTIDIYTHISSERVRKGLNEIFQKN